MSILDSQFMGYGPCRVTARNPWIYMFNQVFFFKNEWTKLLYVN